jgi:hypothetical protein
LSGRVFHHFAAPHPAISATVLRKKSMSLAFTSRKFSQNSARPPPQVPVYALCSWLALIYKEQALYFNVFREAYEALCIYSFFGFLVGYLGGEENIVHHISAKPQQAHTAPIRWCSVADWPMGPAFFLNCKHGCLQYVVIQFVLSIAKFVLHFIPTPGDPNYTLFHESHWTWINSYGYFTTVQNFSQLWAMYCLVLFYLANADDLVNTNPMPKFATVKAVVFLTFWQGVVRMWLIFRSFSPARLIDFRKWRAFAASSRMPVRHSSSWFH